MTLPIVERLRHHAASHQWFVDALTEHYNRMAEEAGSNALPERARQSDHAPVMREAADTIEELVKVLTAVRDYYFLANPSPWTEAQVCDMVCEVLAKISGEA